MDALATTGGAPSVAFTPGNIALWLLGLYPPSVLAAVVLPSPGQSESSKQIEKDQLLSKALPVFVAQTAINTAVIGWAVCKVGNVGCARSMMYGLGGSLAISGALFGYAYHQRKSLFEEQAKLEAAHKVLPPVAPKTGELVSPEF